MESCMKLLKDMTEPELREYCNLLARATESVLPPGPSKNGKCLFVLLICDESKITQYVSNANRDDCIKLMRTTADRLDKNDVMPR